MNKQIPQESISKRLTITIISLAVIPFVLVGAFLSWQIYRNQEEQALNLEQEVVRRLSSEVTSFIQSLEKDLITTIAVSNLKNKPYKQQEEILVTLQFTQRAFDELYLLNQMGKEIVHISRTEIYNKKDLSYKSDNPFYFKTKENRKTYYSDLKVNDIIGVPMMTMAIPIIDLRSNSFWGVLACEVRLKKIWEFIANIELNSGEQVFIINDNNKIIGHSNASIVLRETFFKLPDQPGLGIGLSGNNAIITFKKINFANRTFTVIAERDVKEAMKFARQTSLIVVFILLIVFISATITGISIVKKIVSPIRILANTANAIQNGELNKKAPIIRNDEIGELATAFNNMTEKLGKSLASQESEITIRKAKEEEVNRLNQTLEDRVKERTRLLEAAQKEMVENAHKSGMADIATAVLHNVGNVLNSVLTSASLISSVIERSKTIGLKQANKLLKDNFDNIEDFILHNPKGSKLLQYYLLIGEQIDDEWNYLLENSTRLIEKTNLISDIIISQQSYAMGGFHSEKAFIADVVNDSLKILENSLGKRSIKIKKNYNNTPEVTIQKTKLIHIFLNIFKNSIEAMNNTTPSKRIITIDILFNHKKVICSITDSGSGIKPEDKEKIFTLGFTTKKNGHGFGLHSCANYMTEMDGNLLVQSNGESLGATFILEFLAENMVD